jgi:Flp pilus assembly pilin Flp
MKNFVNKLKAFYANEQGGETVEWVIVAGILVVIALAVYNLTLQTGLQGAMSTLVGNLTPG